MKADRSRNESPRKESERGSLARGQNHPGSLGVENGLHGSLG